MRAARKRSISPLLQQILFGPSRISLKLLKKPQQKPQGEPPRLFRHPPLNRTIIFKSPDFAENLERDGADGEGHSALDFGKPIQTAIYVPNDETAPERGGYAIYLRQIDYERLLIEHLGFDTGRPECAEDARILSVIDDVPSLDAFLLKSALEAKGVAIPAGLLQVPAQEEEAMRRTIVARVLPIVDRALPEMPDRRQQAVAQYVRAIWEPDIPEAKLFIEALRIETAQAAQIFQAWKGITFYEAEFAANKRMAADVVRWLRSPRAIPLDMPHFRSERKEIEERLEATCRKVVNLAQRMKAIFDDYNASYAALIHGNDPHLFRSFLMTAHSRYWVLGYCSNALAHAQSFYQRTVGNAADERLNFEQLHKMLQSLDLLLSSRLHREATL